MLTRRLGTLVIAATLLILAGCGKEESDESLVEIAVKTEKQGEKLDRVAKRIDGMETRLSEMEASLRMMSQASTETGRDRDGEMKTVTPKDRAEFKQIAKAISAIQRRLDLVEGNLTTAGGGVGNEQAPPAEPEDPLAHLEVVDDPQEMHTRLEALLQAFYSQIDDPARREEFEADIQRLKQLVSKPSSGEEEHHALNTLDAGEIHNVAWTLETKPIVTFDGSNQESVWATYVRLAPPSTVTQLRDLVQKYNIPLDSLKDAGFMPNRVAEAKPGPGKQSHSTPKLAAARRKSL